MQPPQLAQYMTSHPQSVAPRDKLSEAGELMSTLAIHHLPVIDNGELVGILSERDLGRFAAPDDLVADAMSRRVATVTRTTPLDEVVSLMSKKSLGAVVVLRQGLRPAQGKRRRRQEVS